MLKELPPESSTKRLSIDGYIYDHVVYPTTDQKFGEELRATRRALNFNLAEAGEILNLPVTVISNIELGRRFEFESESEKHDLLQKLLNAYEDKK